MWKFRQGGAGLRAARSSLMPPPFSDLPELVDTSASSSTDVKRITFGIPR